MHFSKKRLGEVLIETGVIDEHQLLAALGHQKQWGVKLGQALVDLKIATELQIVDALSKKLGYETVRLDRIDPSPGIDAALKLVPRELARAQNLLPLSCDATSVTIAMSDPTNVAIVDEIAFRTGKRVRIVIAGDREVSRSVRKLYFPEELSRSAGIDVPLGGEAMETTTDWFAALPPNLRADYLGPIEIDFDDPPPPVAGPPSAAAAAAAKSQASAGASAAAKSPARPNGQGAAGANEAMLVEVIDRMLRGEKAPGGLEPGRLVAAAVRVLIRKGAVSEAELLAELMRK